jgi:hypothetical protein
MTNGKRAMIYRLVPCFPSGQRSGARAIVFSARCATASKSNPKPDFPLLVKGHGTSQLQFRLFLDDEALH